MSILSSKDGLSNSKLLGNSLSRMYCKDTDRLNISFGNYDNPPFFDLLNYPAEYAIESDTSFPDHCSAMTVFRMPRRTQFGGRYFDILAKNSLFRILETNLSIRFWIKSNSSVSVIFKEKYRFGRITAPCIIYDIPRGYSYGGYPPLESGRRCYAVLIGNIEYSNGTITCGRGRSAVIFSAGTPESAIKEISSKYSKLVMPFLNSSNHFECCVKIAQALNKVSSNVHPRDFCIPSVYTIHEEISTLIDTVQSDAGGLFNIDSKNSVSSVKDQIIVLIAMLKCQNFKSAKKLLSFYYKIWSSGKIPGNYTYSSRTDSPYDDKYAYEGMLMILFGAMRYFDITGDSSCILEIFPMLVSAMNLLTDSCISGTLPFNKMDDFFVKHVISAVCSTHGSCINSMVFYVSGMKFLQFIENTKTENEIISKGSIAKYKRALEEVLSKFKSNFININGNISFNAPERAKKLKTKELYGCCQMCQSNGNKKSYIGWLDRTKNGLYVCPECYSDNIKQIRPKEDPDSQFSLPYIALLCSFYDFPSISTSEYSKMLLNYEMSLRAQIYIRELGLLCCHMKKIGNSSWPDLLNNLIHRLIDERNKISFIDKCFCFNCICKCIY